MRQVVVGLMSDRNPVATLNAPSSDNRDRHERESNDTQTSVQLPAPTVFVSLHISVSQMLE